MHSTFSVLNPHRVDQAGLLEVWKDLSIIVGSELKGYPDINERDTFTATAMVVTDAVGPKLKVAVRLYSGTRRHKTDDTDLVVIQFSRHEDCWLAEMIWPDFLSIGGPSRFEVLSRAANRIVSDLFETTSSKSEVSAA